MKKFLITFFILFGLIQFFSPLTSHAQTAAAASTGLILGATALSPGAGLVTAAAGAIGGTVSTLANTAACAAGPVECATQVFFWILQNIGNFILNIVSWILWACGILLNFSIITVVVHMKDALDKISVVFSIWKILRDFVNMFFIFVLLMIAIQTILGEGNYKKALVRLVLVALFLNFSFFFTGVMIDASNTVALLFYKGFSNSNCVQSTDVGIEAADGCMSYNIVNSLKLQTIYAQPTNTGASTSSSTASTLQKVNNFNLNTSAGITKFLITVIAGSILMIITAGVFLASAVLILYRFVDLVVLLMISPLAFASMILPDTEKRIWSKWWKRLTDQLIFAPVYFMFLWIVMTIITAKTGTGANAVGVLQGALNVDAGSNFISAFGGNMSQMFGLIANYIIVISLLLYSLVLAKELSASGVDVATKASKGLQGFIGRNTVGRAASRIGNSEAMKSFAANSAIGRIAQKPFTSLAKADFELEFGKFGNKKGKGGFEQAEKDWVKKQEDFAKSLGPNALVLKNTEKHFDQKSVAYDQASRAHKETKSAAEAPFVEAEKILIKGEETLDQEAKKTQDNITANEAKIKGFKDKGDIGPELFAAQKELETNTAKLEAINNKKKDIATAKEEFAKTKESAVTKATAETEKRKNAAELERNLARKQKFEISGASKEDAEKYVEEAHQLELEAGRKGFTNEEREKKVKDVQKNNEGKTKARQGEFEKTIENSWFTGRFKRALGSSAVRKNVIKGKSKADQLIEQLKKETEDELKDKPKEADAEPSGDKEKKEDKS